MTDDSDEFFASLAAITPPADVSLTPAERAILDEMKQWPAAWADLPDAPLAEVPGYEIDEELGRGGMGVVYRAREVKLGRSVALKVLLAGSYATPELLARFRREVELLARCTHAGVVRVYEFNTAPEGQPYFSMEYCPGGTLAAALGDRPISPRDGAGIAEGLARTIAAVHEVGLIHRDLKPANVLLTSAFEIGRPWKDVPLKIGDFGLAKAASERGGLTGSGATPGTPNYMAPEQVTAPRSVGTAADVYALGAILYQMLTGRPPFQGVSTDATLRQLVDCEPARVRALQPDVPRDLETVCLKCLEKEPRRRYSTAAALADDLARFLAGQPVAARPVGLRERAWRWTKRRPASAALIGLVTAVAVGLLGGSLWFANYSRQVAAEQTALRSETETERDRARSSLALVLRVMNDVNEGILRNRELQDAGFFELRQAITAPLEKHYLALTQLSGDTPEVRASRLRAYEMMGQVQSFLGDFKRSAETYAKIRAEFANDGTIARKDAPPDRRAQLIETVIGHAFAALQIGQPDDAERFARDTVRLADELAGDCPSEFPCRILQVRAANELCGVLMARDRSQARNEANRALNLLDQLGADFPGLSDHQTLSALDLRAVLLNRRGFLHAPKDRANIDADHRGAATIRERIHRLKPDHPLNRSQLIVVWNHLAILLEEDQKWAEAEAMYLKAFAVAEGMVVEFPILAGPRLCLAQVRMNLARVINRQPSRSAERDRLESDALKDFELLADRFPTAGQYTSDLCKAYAFVASRLAAHPKDAAVALTILDRALRRLESFQQRAPEAPLDKQVLPQIHFLRGLSLATLKLPGKASKAFETARQLDGGGLRARLFAQITINEVNQRQRMLPALRAVEGGDGAKATELAEALLRDDDDIDGQLSYDAARVYSLCAGKVGDGNLETREKHSRRAVSLLRTAGSLGFFGKPANGRRLQTDSDLEVVRSRADFAELVQSLPK